MKTYFHTIRQLLNSNAKADAGKRQGSAKLELKHVAAVTSPLPHNRDLLKLRRFFDYKVKHFRPQKGQTMTSPPLQREFPGQAEKLNQLPLPVSKGRSCWERRSCPGKPRRQVLHLLQGKPHPGVQLRKELNPSGDSLLLYHSPCSPPASLHPPFLLMIAFLTHSNCRKLFFVAMVPLLQHLEHRGQEKCWRRQR